MTNFFQTINALWYPRSAPQATPEEYQQFTRLDEQLTANEIVAFRLKAIAELEEEEALQAVVPLPLQPPRQTWSEWLWRRTPSGGAAAVGTATPQDTQGEDAAARAEFLNAFAPGVDLDGEEEVDPNRWVRSGWLPLIASVSEELSMGDFCAVEVCRLIEN